MIMDATIEVEHKGKKYWVNEQYWNNSIWDHIVLRDENGYQYNKEMTIASTDFDYKDMNYTPKSEVKLWEDIKAVKFGMELIKVNYLGNPYWVVKEWFLRPGVVQLGLRDEEGRFYSKDLSCAEDDKVELKDVWFVHPKELTPWVESDELVKVRKIGHNKIHYVKTVYWNTDRQYVTLRSKNGSAKIYINQKIRKNTTVPDTSSPYPLANIDRDLLEVVSENTGNR